MSTNITLYTKNTSLSEGIRKILENVADLYIQSDVTETNNSEVSLLDLDTMGLSALGKLKEDSFVIVVTEEKGTRYLIESMTFGAFDCITDPLHNPKLIESVKRALGIGLETKGELLEFSGDIIRSGVSCAIVGDSPMLQEVCKLIGRAAAPCSPRGSSHTSPRRR